MLVNQDWYAADVETKRLTFQFKYVTDCLAARKKLVQDIDEFPLEDLQTIDNLWTNYSNGHFGFNVQYQIYTTISTSAL